MRSALSISSTAFASILDRCAACGFDAVAHGPHGACPTPTAYDRFDLDRTSILNGGHWRECESASRDRVMLPTTDRCIGCWAPRIPGDRFCPSCGAALHAGDTIAQILAAPFPPRSLHPMRHAGRKAQAAAVRKLLHGLGIKGVSVTAPSYANASAIHIRIPDDEHVDGTDPRGYRDHEYRTCPRCQRRHVATLRLTSLILAAYPDLDNRSDSQRDHFDYVLSVS
jgi:hypothetical protein